MRVKEHNERSGSLRFQEYGAPQWHQAVPRRPGQPQAEGDNAVWGPPAAQGQNKPAVGDAEGWADAVPVLSAESSASMVSVPYGTPLPPLPMMTIVSATAWAHNALSSGPLHSDMMRCLLS